VTTTCGSRAIEAPLGVPIVEASGYQPAIGWVKQNQDAKGTINTMAGTTGSNAETTEGGEAPVPRPFPAR